ncbi:MAG: hypothetical protein J6I49_01540 [Bacteroidales bacterium]|nr:hypothetical protein [Bacteroidales bacterium]
MTTFKIGDKVKFLNAVGGGVVKRIDGTTVYVEDDTGFDMPMQPSELIRMADQEGKAKAFNDESIGRRPQPVAEPVETGLAFPTIDELEAEVRRLKNQNANLTDQIKQLKAQVLSLQRTIARIS